MSLNPYNLKSSLDELADNDDICIHLQVSGTEDIIKCGILRISRTPIGLELTVESESSSRVSLSAFRESLDDLNEDDHIDYVLHEPNFGNQRMGAIERYQIREHKLILFSFLEPRPVN